MDLAEEVYKLSATFPKEERYGLSSQIRRCSVSVPSNISEGAGRGSNAQFRQFLEYSMGSCNELQTQLELSRRFKYVPDEAADKLTDEAMQVFKMILKFYNGLS